VPGDEGAEHGNPAAEPEDAAALEPRPTDAGSDCGNRASEPSLPVQASGSQSGAPPGPGDAGSEEYAEGADTPQQPDVSADDRVGHPPRLTRRRPTVGERNAGTAPPDGERVTFRSITLAEVYYAHQADQLTEKLSGIRWTGTREQFTAQVAKARQDDTGYDSEFLLRSGASSFPPTMRQYGEETLPAGIDRIAGQVRVLGPSLVTVVLTFVLEESHAIRLDEALRLPVDPENPGAQSRAAVSNVVRVKRERVDRVLDDVTSRCQDWLSKWVPGMLAAGDGRRVPTCSLISLAEGRPFQTPGDYMRLLNMSAGTSGAMRFAQPDYAIFVLDLGARKRRRNLAASFNDQEASKYWDVEAVPEILHENVHSYMIVLALEGVLESFEARMRTTRSALAGFSLDNERKSGAAALSDNLLELSRDIAVTCGDIKGAADDRTAASVWAGYPLLLAADSGEPLGDALDPGAVPRMRLGEVIQNLRGQETELRELVLVTSQAASDAQNAKTASSLNRLTIWLVVLTIVLVMLGVVTLVQDMKKDSGNASDNASSSSSPAPVHTVHPTSIQRSPTSPQGTRSVPASTRPSSP
jgi:hypothetical protein